ncbi:MAG: acyltransferase [Candidatus Lokiarchaeota archaeon]|nr:acyltransferase [Candidatus Lokiarchaeota archaeon]
MTSSKVTIALIQAAAGAEINANLENTGRLVAKAAEQGAKIVCLQELFATRYFAQVEDKEALRLAEPVPGKTSTFLAGLAKEHRVTLVGGSIFELGEDGHRYNTALTFNPEGNVVAKYRKVHVPHDPNFWEKFYFTPGNLGYVHTKVYDITIAPLICYDQWFPEPARILAMRGVQIIFYPTAIGWFPEMKEYEPWTAGRWEAAMRAHASMNAIYVAAVNRTGKEGNLTFWGGSFVADPYGEIVARAPEAEEAVLVVSLDMDRISQSRDGWLLMKNRRPDTYGPLVGKP